MIAIITGDIINSEKHQASEWLNTLKATFSKWGSSPQEWEIYRGDEFQIKIEPQKALWAAIEIKATMRSFKNLDVRMAIGIGAETYTGETVSESNGTAYHRSGRIFETLKEEKLNLAIATGETQQDESMNLILKMALDFMDQWTSVSAEIVTIVLANPQLTQKEIASQLNIQQSAVSQRQKRARLDLVQELLAYYPKTLKRLEL